MQKACLVCGEENLRPEPMQNDMWFCPYCGMRYGKTETEDDEIQKKLAELILTGEECLAVRGGCSDARRIFERITKAHPESAEGWWGLICAVAWDFDLTRLTSDEQIRIYEDVRRIYESAADVLLPEQKRITELFLRLCDAQRHYWDCKATAFACKRELRERAEDETCRMRFEQARKEFNAAYDAYNMRSEEFKEALRAWREKQKR